MNDLIDAIHDNMCGQCIQTYLCYIIYIDVDYTVCEHKDISHTRTYGSIFVSFFCILHNYLKYVYCKNHMSTMS